MSGNPYSLSPRTRCPEGGPHRGLPLDRCTKCKHLLVYEDFLKPQEVKILTIKCMECGSSREVKPQDVHQVVRCKPCQAKRSAARFKGFLKKR